MKDLIGDKYTLPIILNLYKLGWSLTIIFESVFFNICSTVHSNQSL